jgi:hypothetical protein
VQAVEVRIKDWCGKIRTGPSSSWKQVFPGALQGPLEPQDRCEKNIQLTGFNLLNGANVQVGQFR